LAELRLNGALTRIARSMGAVREIGSRLMTGYR
jgi:hypothetical protein